MKLSMLIFCGEVVHLYSSGMLAYGFLLLECHQWYVGSCQSSELGCTEASALGSSHKAGKLVTRSALLFLHWERGCWAVSASVCHTECPLEHHCGAQLFCSQWSRWSNWVPATLQDSEIAVNPLGKSLWEVGMLDVWSSLLLSFLKKARRRVSSQLCDAVPGRGSVYTSVLLSQFAPPSTCYLHMPLWFEFFEMLSPMNHACSMLFICNNRNS